MKIYTLYYKDTGLYNRSIFLLPNDETAKKAMKLNLMETKNENFRNEVSLGNTELKALANFSEENGLENNPEEYVVCNLKELLDDYTRNLEAIKQNNS